MGIQLATLSMQTAMHAQDTTRNSSLAAIAGALGSLESVIWSCDDHAAFAAINDAASIANSTNHITGTSAVKWAKAGTHVNSGISDTFAAVDLSAYAPNDYLILCVNVTDISNIATLVVRLGTDASNYTEFQFDDSVLATGWQLLKIKLADLTSVTGTGMQSAAITYAEVYFIFDTDTDALDDITLDHVAFVSAEAVTTSLVDLETLLTAANALHTTNAAADVATASAMGTTVDEPLAGEDAEGATERTFISLLKRAVNKLISNKAYLATLAGRSGFTGAKGLLLHACNNAEDWVNTYDCLNLDDNLNAVTGPVSVSWDKEGAGAMNKAGIYSWLDEVDSVDITDFVADDYVAMTFMCTNVSELNKVELSIGSTNDAGFDYEWSPETAAIVADEWVTLYAKLSDFTGVPIRVDTDKIRWFRVEITMDANDDTFTDAKIDSIRIVSAEAAYAATHGFAPTASNGLVAVATTDAEWTSITLTAGATEAVFSLSGSSAYVVCQTAEPTDADIGAIMFPGITYAFKTRGRTKIWIRRTATAQATIHVTDSQ